jgi:hypothetical protein
MPYPSTSYGQATPKTALRPFLGWPAYKAGGLRPSSTPLDTPRLTLMSTTLAEEEYGVDFDSMGM